MKRLNVVSNSIRSIGYDANGKQLEVEFHNGRRYRYDRVPHQLYRGLINADSIGNTFHTTIRTAGFPYVELGPDTDSEAKDEEAST